MFLRILTEIAFKELAGVGKRPIALLGRRFAWNGGEPILRS